MRLRRSARKPAKHKARLRRARTPSTSTANATASATDPATARVPGYSAALVSQGLRPATGREQATERRIRAKSHRPGALRGPQAVYNATLDVQGHTTGYRPREGHVSVIDQLRHRIRPCRPCCRPPRCRPAAVYPAPECPAHQSPHLWLFPQLTRCFWRRCGRVFPACEPVYAQKPCVTCVFRVPRPRY